MSEKGMTSNDTPENSCQQPSKDASTDIPLFNAANEQFNNNVTSMMQNPYINSTLNLLKEEIRILELHPGEWSDPITCSLSVVSIARDPHYEALSYAWGDASIRVPVTVDECECMITTNLAAALRRLRQTNKARHLWVDALCINQKDTGERTHQVGLMKKVFSQTDRALLWMGDFLKSPLDEPLATETSEKSSSTDHLMAQLPSERELPSNDTNAPQGIDESRLLTYDEAADCFMLLHRLASGDHYHFTLDPSKENRATASGLRAIGLLMNLPWWKRIWTVQESILAPEAIIMFGSLKLSWKSIVAAARNFDMHTANRCCPKESYDVREYLMKLYNGVLHIDNYRNMHRSSTKMDILKLLQDFHDRMASDPRDKVYALLGVTTYRLEAFRIIPDYSLNVFQVYIQVAMKIINTRNDLRSLIRSREFSRRSDLPSWMPDWSAPTNEVSINAMIARYTQYGYYDACSQRSLMYFLIEPSTLAVKGVEFDEIVKLGQPLSDLDEESFSTCLNDWKAAMDFESTHHLPYIGGGTRQEAFWRLVVRDLLLLKVNFVGEHSYRRMSSSDYINVMAKFHPGKGLFGDAMEDTLHQRFFITRKGFIGMGPYDVKVGDLVHVVFGSQVPFVFRKLSDESTRSSEIDGIPTKPLEKYTYIGDCYVHGIMDGEVVRDVDMNARFFHLV